ncbi:hypothetical protein CJJ07_005101 [Candidozyma auris]|nr:hypothetical protein CJJ07_005101 [[Candida] auris]QEL58478.1 hypothetical protein CJJ09_000514 [[Candida] auris]
MKLLLYAAVAFAVRSNPEWTDCDDCSAITTPSSLEGTLTYTGPVEPGTTQASREPDVESSPTFTVPPSTMIPSQEPTGPSERPVESTTKTSTNAIEPPTETASPSTQPTSDSPGTQVTIPPAVNTSATTPKLSDEPTQEPNPAISSWCVISTFTSIVPSTSLEEVEKCSPKVIESTEVSTLSATSFITNTKVEVKPSTLTVTSSLPARNGFDFTNGSYVSFTEHCITTEYTSYTTGHTVMISSWLETVINTITSYVCEESEQTHTLTGSFSTETGLVVPVTSPPAQGTVTTIPASKTTAPSETSVSTAAPYPTGQSGLISTPVIPGTPVGSICATRTIYVTKTQACAFVQPSNAANGLSPSSIVEALGMLLIIAL